MIGNESAFSMCAFRITLKVNHCHNSNANIYKMKRVSKQKVTNFKRCLSSFSFDSLSKIKKIFTGDCFDGTFCKYLIAHVLKSPKFPSLVYWMPQLIESVHIYYYYRKVMMPDDKSNRNLYTLPLTNTITNN